mmetsp:Transcript_93170/g.216542  ORF Transcript_93170/g.216542 Transcript_93170/m.216542 type:complete len:105 (+) Transcript_93170:2-316(+)
MWLNDGESTVSGDCDYESDEFAWDEQEFALSGSLPCDDEDWPADDDLAEPVWSPIRRAHFSDAEVQAVLPGFRRQEHITLRAVESDTASTRPSILGASGDPRRK